MSLTDTTESGGPIKANQRLPEAIKDQIQFSGKDLVHPPPAFEYIAELGPLNQLELEIIRLTAMFVACNGRNFLLQLMGRESHNPQFDFMKPQHPNFPYFTSLIEQYTKVIIPTKTIVDDLQKTTDYETIVKSVKYRVAWEKQQNAVKDREQMAVEEELKAYNAIDWHDFVVVQTIDFQVSETLGLPPLCDMNEVGIRLIEEKRREAEEIEKQAADMELSDEETEVETMNRQRDTYEVTQPVPLAPRPDSVFVREGYDPKKKASKQKSDLPDKYIISPLTNERLTSDQIGDHIHYNTLSVQQYSKRKRDQQNQAEQDALIESSGSEILSNIAKMSEHRSDIFLTKSRRLQ